MQDLRERAEKAEARMDLLEQRPSEAGPGQDQRRGPICALQGCLEGMQAAAWKPRFFEVKRFCDWGDRRQKGATEEDINKWIESAKAELPEELRKEIAGGVGRALRSATFQIWMKRPAATMDVMFALLDRCRANPLR